MHKSEIVGMNVSVIIPAHNAEDTIEKTLHSLLDQTFPHWEAIVVDDGSNDGTASIVESFINRDPRFRIIVQKNMGLSAARNNGMAQARYDWLLFLDSDDWIFPKHLERLTGALNADPSLDVVYCGWAYVLPDGEPVFEQFENMTGDLFAAHAQHCVSIVHTYIVRRPLVEALGGFDSSLRTCEDWALWQRIARNGARFGAVNEILAAYRTRPGSMSRNGRQLLEDGIQVLIRGHGPDPHVPQPHPVYQDGLSKEQLTKNKFDLLCACAGYLIGGGNDARSLLALLKDEQCSTLNPYSVASFIFIHAMVSASRPRREWYKLWPTLKGNLEDFLSALEAHSKTPGLTRRACWFAKHLMMKYATDPCMSRRIGSIQANLILGKQKLSQRISWIRQFLNRCIWVALLMMPNLEHVVFKMKRSFWPSRRVKTTRHKANSQQYFETLFTGQPDPWNYSNTYEQTKYKQTLTMIPDGPIEEALELACAEGHFTKQLARRVNRLLASDISQTALERGTKRCKDLENVRFLCFDFRSEPIPGRFDFIVCSEVLYYLSDLNELRETVRKFTKSLKPAGYLLMTHSNCIQDDPNSPGFEWGHEFGAKVIGETFARSGYLEFVKELRTPLYRIQLFRRKERINFFRRRHLPQVIEFAQYAPLPQEVAADVVWTTTNQLPILRYRYVGPVSSDVPLHSRVTPEAFEKQLLYLCKAGYHSIRWEEWRYAVDNRAPLAGRAVLITFDEGCRDFLTHAWTLLKRYGFTATIFLFTDEIGRSKTWDPGYGEEIPLLSWKEIRQLQFEGVSFGSHSTTRRDLTSLSYKEVFREIRRSWKTLRNQLAVPVSAFAYPYGKFDKVIQYLVGACGYDFSLSCEPGLCTMNHSLLALPSIEVTGSDNLESFISKLGTSTPSKKTVVAV